MDDKFFNLYLRAGYTSVSNLLLAHFHDVGMNNNELLVYLQLLCFAQQGNYFPDINEIARRLSQSPRNIYAVLDQLEHDEFIKVVIVSDKNHAEHEEYDLSGIFNKLALDQTEEHLKAHDINARQKAFNDIEMGFGRPLTASEMATIASWFDEDHYSAELIELALQEAVLNQAFSVKYMDRVLLNWEHRNIHTKEEVQKERQRWQDNHL